MFEVAKVVHLFISFSIDKRKLIEERRSASRATARSPSRRKRITPLKLLRAPRARPSS